MSEWKKGDFLDYIELNPKVSLKKGDWYPFVDMASVDSVTRIPICLEQKQYTSGVKFQELDTVFARIEPCLQNGKRFLFKDFSNGFGSTEFLVFRAIKNKTIPLFVYYYMQTHRIKNIMINSMTGATGRQRVNNDVFNHLIVTIPPLSIQTRVAEILSRYDSLIENYQKQIKLLEEAAQRLYKEWFVDLHFPGYEKTKIVDGVPEGWEKKCLGDFCFIFTGKKNASSGIKNGKYKFFTCGDKPLSINSYIYDGAAIIISGNGSYTGRTTFFKGKFDLYQRTYACAIKPGFNNNYIYGLYEFVNSELTSKISGGTHGAAVPYIVMSDLTEFTFLYNEYVLLKFSSIIKKNLLETIKLIDRIQLLTETRDRLLPKLMSGEIEV